MELKLGNHDGLDFLFKAVVGNSVMTREAAEQYWTEHREHLSAGIRKAVQHMGRASAMGIVGAGACFDLDLAGLVTDGKIQSLDLIDLNATGVHEALQQVRVGTRDEIRAAVDEKCAFINMDATLFMGDFIAGMQELTENPPPPEREYKTWEWVAEALDPVFNLLRGVIRERQVPPEIVGRYDVVVSDCILSQILVSIELLIQEYLQRTQGRQSGRLELWRTIKTEIPRIVVPDHVDLLAKMLKPGGRMYIASDQVLYKVEVGDDELLASPSLRMECEGGILKNIIVKHCPGVEVEDAKEWHWNRMPEEMYRRKGDLFENEEVHGVLLRKKEEPSS